MASDVVDGGGTERGRLVVLAHFLIWQLTVPMTVQHDGFGCRMLDVPTVKRHSICRLEEHVFHNQAIRFQISHEDCKWLPGELWYGDFTFPHRLRNEGTEPRVHLVIDLVKSDKFLSRLPQNVRDGKRQRQIIRKACQRACRVYTARRYGYLDIGPYKFVLSNK